MKRRERARLLNPLIRPSLADADSRGESLTILRPAELRFSWRQKSPSEIDDERRKHADLANQASIFDKEAKPLEPCPYEFKLRWRDQDGKIRNHTCDDWESVGAFFKFRGQFGETEGLKILKQKYEDEYFKVGLVLGFSTHTRRNVHHGTANQWLLVGLIRLDRSSQGDFFLGAE